MYSASPDITSRTACDKHGREPHAITNTWPSNRGQKCRANSHGENVFSFCASRNEIRICSTPLRTQAKYATHGAVIVRRVHPPPNPSPKPLLFIPLSDTHLPYAFDLPESLEISVTCRSVRLVSAWLSLGGLARCGGVGARAWPKGRKTYWEGGWTSASRPSRSP